MRTTCIWASLVLLGSLVDARAAQGDAPLLEAVRAGDTAAVRALLAQGADVNAAEADGTTALHWASYRDDATTVELLLSAGGRCRGGEPVRRAAAVAGGRGWLCTDAGGPPGGRRRSDADDGGRATDPVRGSNGQRRGGAGPGPPRRGCQRDGDAARADRLDVGSRGGPSGGRSGPPRSRCRRPCQLGQRRARAQAGQEGQPTSNVRPAQLRGRLHPVGVRGSPGRPGDGSSSRGVRRQRARDCPGRQQRPVVRDQQLPLRARRLPRRQWCRSRRD